QIRSQVILNRSRFIILAKGIEELFPSETEETYFIPYCKEGNIISPNRGKLYGKFCNIKKEISKISNIKKTHLSESSDQEINLNHEDYKDSLTWLKNNIEPDITLHKLWKETASYRLKDKNNNMMNTYIALSKPTGHILIDIDFNYMYAGKEMSLFDKFHIFKEKLKIYLEIKGINISKSLIDKLTAPHRPGMCDDDIAVFQILPYLFQPVSIIVQKPPKNTRTIRASKIEQAAAFISNAS
ncbi:Thymidine kinase, partial [Aphis craccivora]